MLRTIQQNVLECSEFPSLTHAERETQQPIFLKNILGLCAEILHPVLFIVRHNLLPGILLTTWKGGGWKFPYKRKEIVIWRLM